MAIVHGPEPWMVRILDERGAVCGAGLLVAADRVLTCAHVVPADPIVDFVDPPGSGRSRAAPVTGGFFPPSETQLGDIALLALETPQPGRRTARLRHFPVGQVERFRAYGFPHADEIGVWAVSTLVGKAGPGGEWIQLHNAGGGPVRPGFSGAGVLAEGYDHLVGMMVAAHPADEQAFMIPVRTIARYLPDVPWIVGPAAVHAEFAGWQPARTPDVATLREVSEFVTGRPGVNVRVLVSGPDDSPGTAAVHAAVMSSDQVTGGVDLMVDCAGRTVAEIVRRIADRAGVEPRHIADEHAPPMTIVVSRVDRAVDPAGVLRSVVHPLSERDRNRILLTFGEEHSAALPLARSIEKERSSRPTAALTAAGARVAEARLAERTTAKLFRRADAVLRGLLPPVARAPELRRELAALTAAARAGQDVGAAAASLRDRAGEAVADALADGDRIAAMLAAHADLRGLLSSYQQLSAQYGHAEDATLTTLYRRAYALLHDGPADQALAEAAVDEFAAAVRARRP